MKYSNYIGAITCLAIIGGCFLPWVFIPSINTTLSGLDTGNTSFGKPGIINIVFSSFAFIFFLVDAIWAKRVNVFLSAFNFAWSLRNFLLFSQCEFGECPEKKIGLFINLACAVIIIVMALFPSNSNKKSGS